MNRELVDNIGKAIFSLPDDDSNRLLTAIVNNIVEIHGRQNAQQLGLNAQNTRELATLEIPIPVPVVSVPVPANVRTMHFVPVYELASQR